jgi:hypothetical protein
VVFVGRHIPGKAQVVINAEDGFPGCQIAQGLDYVEAEDQALDDRIQDDAFRTIRGYCSGEERAENRRSAGIGAYE